MPSVPKALPWNSEGPDLVNRALAVLAQEVGPSSSSKLGELGGLGGPGAHLPAPAAAPRDLQRQAHELLAGIFAAFGQAPPQLGDLGASSPIAMRGAGAAPACPVTKASSPPLGFDKDALRRQAHELIDTLLVTFREVTSEDGVVAENKVPLIQCAAPTPAGSTALATLTVANEEARPVEVTLYCSNFVADNGYEIPSLRVSASPRVTTIAPGAHTSFEIRVAVPPQAPSGTYSGLVQAMGSKYVKAVLSVRVI